jgi:hypothetical protein
MIIVALIALVLYFFAYVAGFVSTIFGWSWGVTHASVKAVRSPRGGYNAVKKQIRYSHDIIVGEGVVPGTVQLVKDGGNVLIAAGQSLLNRADAWLDADENAKDDKT